MTRRTPKILAGALSTATAVLLIGACAPSTGGDAAVQDSGGTSTEPMPAASVDSSLDLDALIAAAKQEGGVTVYDSSGDIEDVAKAFTAKYGIPMEGVKSGSPETAEKMIRENKADNVTIDATMFEDGGVLVGQLVPQHIVHTWVPADLLNDIPEANRNPLLALSKANVFAYNPKLSPGGCPVKNIWDLTEPEWRGKLVMQDPVGKPTVLLLFTQLVAHGSDELEQAYQAKYGKPLETKEQNATWEWIKRIAVNQPVLTGSDEDISAAVGAPTAQDAKIALMSISKFRNNEEKGYQQSVCEGMAPFSGYSYDKYAQIATKTKHPNAAKLFVHFIMTEEGVKHEIAEGGVSGNSKVPAFGLPLPGLSDWDKDLFHVDSSLLADDFKNRQDVTDFWRVNHG
jgi:iron(III) transport system substrate-binding protein